MVNILYFDIDSLRPDHLGCYGYHRNTSPNLDRIAREGIRLRNCYVSDAPCVPSRSCLSTGLFGIHHGAVAHRGSRARLFSEQGRRGFRSRLHEAGWFSNLRAAGVRTASISSFMHNHSAWHWTAGFAETYDTHQFGLDRVEDIEPLAEDWLRRHARNGPWFLHLNFWDVHVPYRTPESYGNPFAGQPVSPWLTEEILQRHRESGGLRSARHLLPAREPSPRYPESIGSMADVRRLIDGYDTSIRYVDDCIGRLVAGLEALGIRENTAILIGSDHGECLGEMGAYGAHQLANEQTVHVPMILSWPGLPSGREDTALHYSLDVAATTLDLLGITPQASGDGRSFAEGLRQGKSIGREFLVLSHLAQGVQRSVRFQFGERSYLATRTFHDAFHRLPEWMLFDLDQDPRGLANLALTHPVVLDRAKELLAEWLTKALDQSDEGDPLETVLREGTEAEAQRESHFRRLETAGQKELAAYFRRRSRGHEPEAA